jgi:bacterioferritin
MKSCIERDVMQKNELIALLNKDLADEHGAIIQYLTHAYAMGEGEIACEIEAIAREEMRHLDWLAETIVELGGVPSLERGTMRMEGKAVADWMGNDVMLEEGAIKQYREHIEAVDDPEIKRLLRRILSDEGSHRGDFRHFVDKVQREAAEDLRGVRKTEVTRILNWGIEHEYTVILQYMFQSYMTTDEETKKQLEDQAINEMQHLGWLAEELVGISSTPIIEHIEVNQSSDRTEMLEADIKIEREVAAEYDRAAKEMDTPELARLLRRLRDHELYHVEVFGDLLRKKE